MAATRGARTALVAVSGPGANLALRLGDALADADVFLPERVRPASAVAVHRWQGHLSDLLPRLLGEYAALVVFGSVGMTVRLIAGSIVSKHTDPAVVVVDDGGGFAVSLLSGHVGGANALARRVAKVLGATPVITTASEALDTIAVDLLGVELGWRIEGGASLTRVSAAIVNGETVGLVQETGVRDWLPKGKILPANVVSFPDCDSLVAAHCQAAVVISDRMLTGPSDAMPPTVVYRPRSLVVGIGCNRGTSPEEIDEVVTAAMTDQGVVLASIRNLATIDLKRDEEGLTEYAKQVSLPIVYFTAQELERLAGIPNPSAIVRECVGVGGVCEPAALLSSGATTLLAAKRKTRNVTLAVARVDFSKAGGM